MGMPPMNPAEMLAMQFGGNLAAGWLMHFGIGITLAVGYALVAPWLPGPPVARGALYGLAPFLVAQVAVMPMMGMPLFSGSAAMALGSLVGHLVYGGAVGAILGHPAEAPEPSAAHLQTHVP
jgi:uncharacterized membrane protein YagU involved in acid resistance